MNMPTQRFTGIFIPVEILERDDLTLFEERLLAIIDSLYCKDFGGCFASNEYLAKKMKNAKVNTVVKALVKLRKLGLVVDVSFNGRQRVIRTSIGKMIEQGQSQSACDLNHTLPVTKITPCMGQKSHPIGGAHIVERKEEKKVEKTRVRATPPQYEFGKKIKMDMSQYEAFVKKYGQKKVALYLEEMEDYLAAHGKTYKDYAAALRNWIRRDKSQKGEGVDSENKEVAERIAKRFDTLEPGEKKGYIIEALNKSILIDFPRAQSSGFELRYTEKGFKEQLVSHLRKIGLEKCID